MSVYIKFVLNLEKRRIKQIIHIRKTFLDEDGFWLYILKVWINIEVPMKPHILHFFFLII
jgi:hypothetical protein